MITNNDTESIKRLAKLACKGAPYQYIGVELRKKYVLILLDDEIVGTIVRKDHDLIASVSGKKLVELYGDAAPVADWMKKTYGLDRSVVEEGCPFCGATQGSSHSIRCLYTWDKRNRNSKF